MPWRHTIGVWSTVRRFETLLAKASPARSGDDLAAISARTAEERVAAQMALADLPLSTFQSELLIPYETDEVTRLIVHEQDRAAFGPVSHLTVGEFRDWLLTPRPLGKLSLSLRRPDAEMAAAVSKLMRVQDLITVAAKFAW